MTPFFPGDALTGHHKGYQFVTRDTCSCPYKGGWWYDSGTEQSSSNLNGLYVGASLPEQGIMWQNYTQSLKKSELKIRPRNFGNTGGRFLVTLCYKEDI